MKLNILLESLDPKKFDVLSKYVSDKYAKLVDEQLEVLSNALKTGVIYNVTYGEIKDLMSRVLEMSLHKIDDETDRSIIHHAYINDYGGTYIYLNQAAGKLKKEQAEIKGKNAEMTTYLKKRIEVLEAAAEIWKHLQELKPKIIKGRKPSQKFDPNAFQQKLGSKEAQEIVIKAVKPEIEKQLDEYEKILKDYLQRGIDSLKTKGEFSRMYNDPPSINQMLLQKCFEYDIERPSYKERHEKPTKYSNFKLTSEGKKFPTKEAKDSRDGIEQRFLGKIVKKLSHLLELKGNLDKIETLKSRPAEVKSGSGTVEVGFHFKFTDGSQFKVINKVVNKYSYTGTPFEQYPTTFHDVTFPDGSKMKTPSEEKMIKEFGAKK